jgi:ferredoxin
VVTIKLVQSGEVFEAAPDETILEAAERAGVFMAHSCLSGTCRSCMTQVLAGTVEHDPEYIDDLHIDEDEIADGFRLLCSAFARTDVDLDR